MVHDRTIQTSTDKRRITDAKQQMIYLRRLSGIELPWTLREGLSLDMRRLS